MIKWLGMAVALLVASGAFAQQEQPGAADFLACQDAVGKNDFDAVIASCEKALGANADLFAGNYYLGYAYRAKKDYDKCAANFETFIQKVGNNAQAADMINNSTREGGLCYARGSSPAKAVALLTKAAGTKPNDTEIQFYLGITQMRANREPQAEQAFAKVIQLDPTLAPAYYYAGRINFNGQDFAQASQRLEKYLELAPNEAFAAEAHFMVGSIAIRGAEGSADASAAQQKAITHLTQFLEAKPDAPQSPQAHYILGSLAAQKDDNATAKMHFERYLELEPNGPQAEEVKQFLAELNEAEAGS
jgi:tetratricopeptide (TPR) repeat protein